VSDQFAKIGNLSAGTHKYKTLGLLRFDGRSDWREHDSCYLLG
jgi:hypothetical protein